MASRQVIDTVTPRHIDGPSHPTERRTTSTRTGVPPLAIEVHFDRYIAVANPPHARMHCPRHNCEDDVITRDYCRCDCARVTSKVRMSIRRIVHSRE